MCVFREKLMMKDEVFRWIALGLFVLIIVYLFTGIFPWWVLAVIDIAAIALSVIRWRQLRRTGATTEARRRFFSSIRIFILLTVLIIIALIIPPGS